MPDEELDEDEEVPAAFVARPAYGEVWTRDAGEIVYLVFDGVPLVYDEDQLIL